MWLYRISRANMRFLNFSPVKLSNGRPPGAAHRHSHIMKEGSCLLWQWGRRRSRLSEWTWWAHSCSADSTLLDGRSNDSHSSGRRHWQELACTHQHKGPFPFSLTEPLPERWHSDTPTTKQDRTLTKLFMKLFFGALTCLLCSQLHTNSWWGICWNWKSFNC